MNPKTEKRLVIEVLAYLFAMVLICVVLASMAKISNNIANRTDTTKPKFDKRFFAKEVSGDYSQKNPEKENSTPVAEEWSEEYVKKLNKDLEKAEKYALKHGDKPSKSSPTPTPQTPEPVSARRESVELMLATLDNGYAEEGDRLVLRFKSLLDQVSSQVVENREGIADMTVACRDFMKERGVEESLENIMQNVNRGLIRSGRSDQKYAEYAAYFGAARVGGTPASEINYPF